MRAILIRVRQLVDLDRLDIVAVSLGRHYHLTPIILLLLLLLMLLLLFLDLLLYSRQAASLAGGALLKQTSSLLHRN